MAMRQSGQQMETENRERTKSSASRLVSQAYVAPGFQIALRRTLIRKPGWTGIACRTLKPTESDFSGLGCRLAISRFKICTSDSNYSEAWEPCLSTSNQSGSPAGEFQNHLENLWKPETRAVVVFTPLRSSAYWNGDLLNLRELNI